MGGGAERHFDASASDVDDDRGAGADVHAVSGSEMNEPRFFRPRNDADSNTGLSPDLADEIATVRSFTGGAPRGYHNLFDFVRFGEAFEFGERLHGRRHRRVRQLAAVQ